MPETPETTGPTIDYAQRRQQRSSERAVSRHAGSIKPLLIVAVIVAVLALGATFEAFATWGKIHPGVSIGGVEVGGMLPGQALTVLDTGLAKRSSKPVVVTYQGKKWTVGAADIGLTFDKRSLVDQAMTVGRSGGFPSNLGDRLRSWTKGTKIDATTRASATSIDKTLDEIASGTNVTPVDAGVTIKGVTPTVTSAKPGMVLDRAAATHAIVVAMLSTARVVAAPVITDPVAVDDREARDAALRAEMMLSGPATVTFDKRTWTFKPSQIAEWIVFLRSDATTEPATGSSKGVTLEALISPKHAAAAVTKAFGAKVGRPAVDARFKTSNGAISIVPSRDGIGPDVEGLSRELTTSLTDPNSARTVELRTTITKPKVTTEDARTMGIKRRISVYTTTYSAGNKPRTNNIHTLGDALDGTLIAPGDVFSFNGTIGQRTAQKGYQEAFAIVDGKLVPQLGGGICQVGTTIFNTIFESGLPILERKNHSFYISHYPKGRDATISWGGPDFKFKNDTNHWVLISVSYTSSSITIALYGTDPGYEVEATTSDWRNVKPFSIETVKDSSMEKGSKIIEDSGVDGRTITVERTVSKDGKVIRTDKFVSVYKPKTQVVRVGTMVVSPSKDPAKGTTATQ
ncbi:MAG: hypothetical protein CVT67_00195 [Actinobacteria bacterium HGW-Actinobacteria-7]|nr:MAG: hypothetical protein CVT67_00195 [Actinobacteria bacterium HGW-Actinobacteria-7]